MSSASNNSFTRGAQLWAHNIRMGVQATRNLLLVGLLADLSLLLFRAMEYMGFKCIYYFAIERYAALQMAIANLFAIKGVSYISFYSLGGGEFITRASSDFIYRFWHVTIYGQQVAVFKYWLLEYGLFELTIMFVLGIVCSVFYFIYHGQSVVKKKKIRGSKIVTSRNLSWRLQLAGKASKIRISGLPLVKGTETQHLLITGTTGSGKTNMLNELLPQIRRSKQRAIIFDVTGNFVDRFFDPKRDKLLNPLASNTEHWLPWNDCETEDELNNLASAFVDGQSLQTDKYWEEAAQKVFAEALRKDQKSRSIEALLRVIGKADLKKFCEYFADTYAAAFVSKEAEKGTASVRSTLLNKIERLKYLKDGGEFSIKRWVNEGQGWLFITAMPNQLVTLRPLISAWIDIAIKGLLMRPHNVTNEKMWFVLDELPSLQKIPALKTGLAQGRKYGACFVAGIQNISQLEEIYGRAGSISLLDMFNTRFYFAVSDNQIADYAAKSLGESEIEEAKESLSYGSNTMRDGVNINTTVRTMPLVLPNQIKDLPPRTCYVKLPQGFPITKLKVNLQKVKAKKVKKGFAIGQIINQTTNEIKEVI